MPIAKPPSAVPAITRGLVIRQPWVEHILSGRKTWELRGRTTRIREAVALIEGGSGLITGIAWITNSRGPLSRPERLAAARAGQILDIEVDEDMYAEVYAWELEGVQRLSTPVPYTHPSGAVIWVTLPELDARALSRRLATDARPVVSSRAVARAPSR